MKFQGRFSGKYPQKFDGRHYSGRRWLGGGLPAFEPIAGLGDLNDGVYTDFRDGSLTGARGGTWSLTRASATTSLDSSDLVTNISSGSPRWHRIGAGSGVTGLAVRGAHTNICLQSEDFGTTWAAIAGTTPTRSAAATTCGVVSLDLLGDDSAVLTEGYTQTFAYTGDGVKAHSFYFAKGTATSSVIRLRDVTGVTNRILAAITWSGATPSITMTTGTLEGIDTLGNNVFRARIVSTSVTAASTHALEFYPATDAALAGGATGNIYIGGVMAQNATSVFPYIKTTTGSVTVPADVVTLSGASIINQAEGALWMQVAGPAAINAGGVNIYFGIDDGTDNNFVRVREQSGSTLLFVLNGGAAQASPSLTNTAAGVASKLAGRYRLNDTQYSKNGATGTADTACTMPTTTTFRLGAVAAGQEPNTVIQQVAYSRTGATDASLATATT